MLSKGLLGQSAHGSVYLDAYNGDPEQDEVTRSANYDIKPNRVIYSGKTATSLNNMVTSQAISATDAQIEEASSDGEIEKMESVLGDDSDPQKHL